MKKCTYTCDVCGKTIRRDSDGRLEHAAVRMLAHGYGMQDGEHLYCADICSSACGLVALRAAIASIEAGDNRAFDEKTTALIERTHGRKP